MMIFMEEWIQQLSWLSLVAIMIFAIYILGKSADLLVELGINLSLRWNIPKLIIGTTIISLGTTLPEVAVSVMAGLQGKSAIALGNAVGSIICDTGLILSLAILIGRIPIDKKISNRQGVIQLFVGILLVLVSIKYFSLDQTLQLGGHFTQLAGAFFLVLLGVYFFFSMKWAKAAKKTQISQEELSHYKTSSSVYSLFTKLIVMALLLAISSEFLILSASEVASRLHVPHSIIAVTIVAFGTSLPELVTVLSAVRKNHGDLALGNVIGADILNVLLVAGSAAALTPGGLHVEPIFFSRSFPIMLSVLLVLRLGLFFSDKHLKKWVGYLLLILYILMTTLNMREALL